jgi:hypothetical protein
MTIQATADPVGKIVDIGNGVRLPFGISVAQFMALSPDAVLPQTNGAAAPRRFGGRRL